MEYGSTSKKLYINNEIKTEIIIPEEVVSIGAYAFYGCAELTSVTIPDSVIFIGGYAFKYCSGVTSITIPDSVAIIGDYAFEYCSGLTCVIWNAEDCTVMENCFGGCGITQVTIGENVKRIPSGVFMNCDRLTSITIPDSITSIGDLAFGYCSGLEKVYYKGTLEQWNNILFYYGNNSYLTSAPRYYYSETEPTLSADGTAYDGNYWHYAPDGITPVIWKNEN